MKRTFNLLLLFLLFFNSFQSTAQIMQGRMFIGGQFIYNSSDNSTSIIGSGNVSGTTNSSNSRTISIIPYYSYCLSSKWGLGLGLGYVQTTSDATSTSSSVSGISVVPFVRYYIPTNNSGSRFYFYGQAKLSLTFGNASSTLNAVTNTGTSNTTDVAISPGFIFFPAKRWAFDILVRGLGYSTQTIKSDAGASSTTSGFDIGVNMLTPSFGLVFFIK